MTNKKKYSKKNAKSVSGNERKCRRGKRSASRWCAPHLPAYTPKILCATTDHYHQSLRASPHSFSLYSPFPAFCIFISRCTGSAGPSPRPGERVRSRPHILISPSFLHHILPPIRAPSCHTPALLLPSPHLRPSPPFSQLKCALPPTHTTQTPPPCAQSTWQNSRPSCSARR